jgi:hypothetical protein
VLACDIDEGIRKIYKANYGIEPVKDIRSIDVTAMPDFDVLCAGFPCQPFSIAGNGEGFKDKEKGNLFYDILNILDAKQPPMCILENVKQLKTHDGGNTYKTIEMELVKRQYHLTSKIINAADYGSRSWPAGPLGLRPEFVMASGTDFGIAKGFTCGLCWVLRKDLLAGYGWVTPEGMPTLTIIGKEIRYDNTRITPYRSQVAYPTLGRMP